MRKKSKATRSGAKDNLDVLVRFIEEQIHAHRIAHMELVMELRFLRQSATALINEMKQSGTAHTRELFWELIRERDELKVRLANFPSSPWHLTTKDADPPTGKTGNGCDE